VVIEVSIPSSMAILHSFPVETVVGSHLQAAVTMKASNGDAISWNHLNLPFVVAG
jgi:nuclear pore complex protein Nup210